MTSERIKYFEPVQKCMAIDLSAYPWGKCRYYYYREIGSEIITEVAEIAQI